MFPYVTMFLRHFSGVSRDQQETSYFREVPLLTQKSILATLIDEAISCELHWIKLRKHPFEWGVFWYDGDDACEDACCDTSWACVTIRNEKIASFEKFMIKIMNTLNKRTLACGLAGDKDRYTEIGESLNDKITSFTIVKIDTGDISSGLREAQISRRSSFFALFLRAMTRSLRSSE